MDGLRLWSWRHLMPFGKTLNHRFHGFQRWSAMRFNAVGSTLSLPSLARRRHADQAPARPSMAGRSASPPADGFHDSGAVLILEVGLAPATAWHDLAVEFHRDTPAAQTKTSEQIRDGERGRQRSRFAVEADLHELRAKKRGVDFNPRPARAAGNRLRRRQGR